MQRVIFLEEGWVLHVESSHSRLDYVLQVTYVFYKTARHLFLLIFETFDLRIEGPIDLLDCCLNAGLHERSIFF